MASNSPVALQQTSVIPDEEEEPSFISRVALLPLRISVTLISKVFRLLRPLAPQLIPLAVCLIFIPIIVLLSISSGWIVWKNVAVSWETTLWLQYGDGVPPYASAAIPSVVPQQRYDITLELVVPATESNFGLGNFMTSLTLSTPANKTLTFVRRPAIALPSRTFFTQPNVVRLRVPLLSSYVAGTSRIVAKLELGRRDSWTTLGKGEGREISVVSASLKGTVRHHGVRGLVTRFPLTSALLSATTFFLLASFILAACVLPTISRRTSPILEETQPIEPQPPVRSDDSGSDGDEKPARRRRRSKRRANIKKEESPTASMPPAEPTPTTTPLRRRRSQLADQTNDSE